MSDEFAHRGPVDAVAGDPGWESQTRPGARDALALASFWIGVAVIAVDAILSLALVAAIRSIGYDSYGVIDGVLRGLGAVAALAGLALGIVALVRLRRRSGRPVLAGAGTALNAVVLFQAITGLFYALASSLAS